MARARVFVSTDPDRSALLDHVMEIAGLTGADRVGLVWVDEYSPELAHPYFVVDLAVSPPRHHYSAHFLARAWEAGVPGTLDEAYADSGSAFAVALGSDGSRGWFVVADSLTRRPQISDAARERLMFLVGECSALVLHKDLRTDTSFTGVGGSAFLRDLEGRDDDALARAEIERRFAVGRLGRLLVDEDMIVSEQERRDTARRLRSEIDAAGPLESGEVGPYHRLLDAFAASDHGAVARAMLDIGSYAESRDHRYGALQAYAVAFDVAGRRHDAEVAIDAARFAGRILRRRAEWERADLWYQAAVSIARLERLDGLASLSLTGVAVVKRERGNLPAARATVEEALRLADRSGASEPMAAARHTLMGMQQQAEEYTEALQSGWTAYHLYDPKSDKRVNCLTGIAALLQKMGDLDASEDAFIVVAHTAREFYFRLYAHDALSYIAALRGDGALFDQRAAATDALDWESGPLSVKAEILVYRGLSLKALGRVSEAEAWLERAVAFCSEHNFNRSLFAAEEALEQLRSEPVEAEPTIECPLPEVREGLRQLREATLIGAS